MSIMNEFGGVGWNGIRVSCWSVGYWHINSHSRKQHKHSERQYNTNDRPAGLFSEGRKFHVRRCISIVCVAGMTGSFLLRHRYIPFLFVLLSQQGVVALKMRWRLDLR
jgi:hypothetical protein